MPRYFRKVIRISAECSPNVRRGKLMASLGLTPDHKEVVPGVLPFALYLKRRATWDIIRQTIGLDGMFYEGAEIMLYPPDWLNIANSRWHILNTEMRPRRARAIGIDPAEGGDKTAMSAVDEFGLIELVSKKTPDTTVVTDEAIAFGLRHQVPPELWLFDRGGGGKQHADRLRKQGYHCRTVAFGEAPTLDIRRGTHQLEDRKEMKEEQYSYVNRRAEMYGDLRQLIDPFSTWYLPQSKFGGEAREEGYCGWALPPKEAGDVYDQLRSQLRPIPLMYNGEGRLELPPKNKRDINENQTKKTLVQLIGHSPDEADSVVLAVHAMLHPAKKAKAG